MQVHLVAHNKLLLSTFVSMSIVSFMAGCNIASNGDCIQGRRWFDAGNYNQALGSFQQALQKNPQNPDAFYNIGAVYQRMAAQSNNNNWLPYAETNFRQAIALNDQHVEAHRALAVLLIQTNRQNHAFELVRTWQQRHPESPEPLVELARLHQEYGDQQRAVQYLADALGIDGRNARAHYALGVIREQQGQYQLALDNYVRSYQSNNLQTGLVQKIASLQSRLQTAAIPQYNNQNRQGALTQPGTASQYVPH